MKLSIIVHFKEIQKVEHGLTPDIIHDIFEKKKICHLKPVIDYIFPPELLNLPVIYQKQYLSKVQKCRKI